MAKADDSVPLSLDADFDGHYFIRFTNDEIKALELIAYYKSYGCDISAGGIFIQSDNVSLVAEVINQSVESGLKAIVYKDSNDNVLYNPVSNFISLEFSMLFTVNSDGTIKDKWCFDRAYIVLMDGERPSDELAEFFRQSVYRSLGEIAGFALPRFMNKGIGQFAAKYYEVLRIIFALPIKSYYTVGETYKEEIFRMLTNDSFSLSKQMVLRTVKNVLIRGMMDKKGAAKLSDADQKDLIAFFEKLNLEIDKNTEVFGMRYNIESLEEVKSRKPFTIA